VISYVEMLLCEESYLSMIGDVEIVN